MHPVLFHAFGVPIQAYAVLSIVGYAGGVGAGVALGLRDGRSARELIDIALVAVISALLGSKVFHTLFEARGHLLTDGTMANGVVDLLRDDPWHWARLFEAGYVFYGGVVGAVAITYLYAVRCGIRDKGAIGDYAVPGLLFGTLVGRIGCFLGGCCYGAPTTMPWGVVFPAGHPSGGVAVHPTELYDAAFGLVGLIAFIALYGRRRFDGEALCAYVVSYAFFRGTTEMFRADSDRGLWLGGLSTSQLVALLTIPLGLAIWIRERRRRPDRRHTHQRGSRGVAAPAPPP